MVRLDNCKKQLFKKKRGASLTFQPFKASGEEDIFLSLLRDETKILVSTPKSVSKLLQCDTSHSNGKQIMVFIPKPGKNNHFLAKSLRPIYLS